jgi:hypothetical protein
MYKLIGLGIFIPILILTAPNACALTSAERYSSGFSDGGQQAATDYQNHIPFDSACDPTGVHTTDGKHTVYYCAGWYKGYTATWHNLVQAIPHAIPPLAQQSVKPAAAGVTPQPPITSNAKANIFSTSVGNATNSNTATISVHTVNTIQGSNDKILIQEEPIIRKVILSNINNAILMAKGNIKGNISVSVNTKIINDMANRVSTTQGIDFTKALVATELVNAIKTMKTNRITTAANMTVTQQLPKVVIDNQAICTGLSSPTSAACAFIINIHG